MSEKGQRAVALGVGAGLIVWGLAGLAGVTVPGVVWVVLATVVAWSAGRAELRERARRRTPGYRVATAFLQAVEQNALMRRVGDGQVAHQVWVHAIEPHALGWLLRIGIWQGLSFDQLERAREGLAASLCGLGVRCSDVRFEREADSAGHGQAIIVQTDPLAQTSRPPWLPGATAAAPSSNGRVAV